MALMASAISDEVCVLFDENVPYMIRRQRKYCNFVNEYYIYKLIDWEVINMLDERRIENFLFI